MSSPKHLQLLPQNLFRPRIDQRLLEKRPERLRANVGLNPGPAPQRCLARPGMARLFVPNPRSGNFPGCRVVARNRVNAHERVIARFAEIRCSGLAPNGAPVGLGTGSRLVAGDRFIRPLPVCA
jgi:hypothetical protein